MARPLRIEFPGAIYHVTSRGNEARRIFVDDRDRKHLLEVLHRSVDDFAVDLFAYVLMPNHYHLLVRTRRANLGAFMHGLNTSYVAWYNVRQNRVGHLFQGRYHGVLVEEAAYLARVSAYVHANPVAVKTWRDRPFAERWSHLIEYPWSSLHAYISHRAQVPRGIVTEPVWSAIGARSAEEGRAAYRAYLRDWLRRSDWRLHDDVRGQALLGSEDFERSVRDRLRAEHIQDGGVRGAQERMPESTAAHVLKRALEVTGFDPDKVDRRTRGGMERPILIYLTRRAGGHALADVGRLFGVSAAAVSKSVAATEKALERDRELQRRVGRWRDLLS